MECKYVVMVTYNMFYIQGDFIAFIDLFTALHKRNLDMLLFLRGDCNNFEIFFVIFPMT